MLFVGLFVFIAASQLTDTEGALTFLFSCYFLCCLPAVLVLVPGSKCYSSSWL